MKMLEYFSPPDGEIVENPAPDRLRNLILNEGEDYWNAGAGQASLTCREDGSTKVLLLTMEPSLGFYLEYVDPDKVYYIPFKGGTFDDTVTVYVGGDPLLLPAAFFVPRELAWAAAEEFCRSGGRTDKITWKNRTEVNWHYGYPDDAE